MAKKLLIDAAHPEETRVAVVEDEQLVGFEYESYNKQQITGNIYLARVVRIEAALQSVFVEYGGNRHGFLAFQEIHRDYFNIPVGDQTSNGENSVNADTGHAANLETVVNSAVNMTEASDTISNEVSGDDVEAAVTRSSRPIRSYRIQEVIRKNQILLVQVNKEERGNKGAALTTFISLAGRYCVLMPNSERGGGISRKITGITDRRKLKEILGDISVPTSAALIIRTAGINRTKQEIKRDYEFLVRQWNEIRELALKSVAPAKIYEEGNLIRRAIRDDYSKEMEEILVQGNLGYKAAKKFMRMILPSHAKKVKQHPIGMPIFADHGIEKDITELFEPVVHLRSGGYIVIDRTEALISVDVNSGRSIRHGTLEKTALQTNLEAAEAIATQMRLRELAGLIVVDFIDMEESKNNQAVERRLRDCLKADRSRTQVGQISGFGLLEMSRQRMKPGLLEIANCDCTICRGSGQVRSPESLSIDVLRRIEAECAKESQHIIQASVPLSIANLLLNDKRQTVVEIENRHKVSVVINGVDAMAYENLEIRRLKPTEGEGSESAEVIGVETPYRRDEQVRTEKRTEGQRRRRRRNQKSGGRRSGKDSSNIKLQTETPNENALSLDERPEASTGENEIEKAKPSRKRNRKPRKPATTDLASGKGKTTVEANEDSVDKATPDSSKPKPQRRRKAREQSEPSDTTSNSGKNQDTASSTLSHTSEVNVSGEQAPKPNGGRKASRSTKKPSRRKKPQTVDASSEDSRVELSLNEKPED